MAHNKQTKVELDWSYSITKVIKRHSKDGIRMKPNCLETARKSTNDLETYSCKSTQATVYHLEKVKIMTTKHALRFSKKLYAPHEVEGINNTANNHSIINRSMTTNNTRPKSFHRGPMLRTELKGPINTANKHNIKKSWYTCRISWKLCSKD